MPQMAPLSWINLMIMFVIIFMTLNTLNYFSFMYENKTKKSTPEKKLINWKW